ncbi:bifunctional 3-(3-hydroxy-phenyl)propionate/3-hydroxycinnamic acid hydroxylase [Comamonadaceae bacterium G21597-S1]|nr:bifunctional 3-(3-hydroxy-phenyl)propionate/3-hydroxycinnamic acid hydroxylase [Comamonadaceae bacterium G21597-S1]
MKSLSTQVAIIGAGPCGVTLANHLGLHGIEVVLIDRSPDVLDYPRAVGVDDEALRSWQTVGLSEKLVKDMVQNPPVRYHNSRGHCFARIRPAAQPFGWPRRNMFLQPLTEATLREGLARFAHVRCLFGTEVTALRQDAEKVVLSARDSDGAELEVVCAYAVGADGGRSTVRGQIGVELTGQTDAFRWLVVDVENDRLHAPFSGVYCDPQRPHMSIDLPYGFRRFEFMLQPDDDEQQVQSEQHLARLMRPHYPEGVPLPKVRRSRMYLHHSRIASAFRVGRVFLAGDAAHLQPPFFGQGMNSGLRDATNLGWKLAAVLQGRLPESALDSYEAERRDHALAMVQFATWIGRLYRPYNRITERVRDAFFRAVQSLPSIRDYILQLRFKPMPKYTRGLVLRGGHPMLGTMFMQPDVETEDGRRIKLDDAIGPGFCVLGVNVDPARALSTDDRAFWHRLGATLIRVNRSRAGSHLKSKSAEDSKTIVLDDIEGRFRDWLDDSAPNDLVVLRPDRYVAAVCHHRDASAMTRAYGELLGDR